MFDLINGTPLHPLVVHAIVVLLPVAVIGTLAMVVRPAWRLKYGHLVVAAAAVAAVLTPIATASGGELEKRVGDPGTHAALGDQLIWFEIPLLVLALALVLVERARATAAAGGTPRVKVTPLVVNAVAVLAVVAALASAVQVYRVGDSGAKKAWEDAVTPAASSAP